MIRKVKGPSFKLQVYVPVHIVRDIDKICKNKEIYRSEFVAEAVDRFLKLAKNQKHLEKKVKEK